jgi:hypothetical protein
MIQDRPTPIRNGCVCVLQRGSPCWHIRYCCSPSAPRRRRAERYSSCVLRADRWGGPCPPKECHSPRSQPEAVHNEKMALTTLSHCSVPRRRQRQAIVSMPRSTTTRVELPLPTGAGAAPRSNLSPRTGRNAAPSDGASLARCWAGATCALLPPARCLRLATNSIG